MIQSIFHAVGDVQWSQFHDDPALGAKRLELEDGAVVYEPYSSARDVYYIHAGQVQTYEAGPDESARLLQILGPGEWFGEAALAAADWHSSRAVTASPTVLWVMPAERLIALLSNKPKAAAELIRQLASRLQTAREEANHLVFDDCNSRLVKTLLRFSKTAAATQQDNGTVMLRITHRQLAQAVGAARETVSLALTQLRQQNLLRTGRNRLQFSPEAWNR